VDAHWNQAFAVTKVLLRKFKDTVEANGSKFLLVTLSNAEQIHPELQRQIEDQYQVAFDFERPDRIIREFAEKENISHLELMPRFRDFHLRTGKYLHGFDGGKGGHWNEKGHRLAAHEIVEFLKRQQLVRTGQSQNDKIRHSRSRAG
jgi:hypothetical protein